VRDRGEAADRGLDGQGEVRGVHRLGDVQRTEVAGDVPTHLVVREVHVHGRGGRDLQDLGAQVRVGDLAGDGVRAVHGVLEHDVRVAGLELDLGQDLEEVAGLDLLLRDARVVHHVVVDLRDVHVSEG